MITINLSEEQAKSLLYSLGWRWCDDPKYHDNVTIESNVASELFTQLEHKLMPASTSAAELAVWRHENGLNEMDVEKWKRKNEVLA
ncbi:hypothetical protein [Salmonella phage phSE-5]|uniref:Uncharacterized protein n=2 Tax=Tlsvirus phSE2 TaxID=2734013 RepID=A0A160CAD3_9CAUD|nr:hypothetical protein BI068_gp08 [Salmonella phage phSE-2]ANA49687.1 hypothetical protein [Salmonella phage phSE-2]ANA49791.1 hypothetical protein [Salmonella phage phSE-5]